MISSREIGDLEVEALSPDETDCHNANLVDHVKFGYLSHHLVVQNITASASLTP